MEVKELVRIRSIADDSAADHGHKRCDSPPHALFSHRLCLPDVPASQPSSAVHQPGCAFERSHTILGLREGVHTPSGGVNTGSVHTENVVFTQKKWCSHTRCSHRKSGVHRKHGVHTVFCPISQMVDVGRTILSDFEAFSSDFEAI